MGFEILNLNIRSLPKKWAHFRALVEKSNYDVIILTESWLRSEISDNQICLDNYNIARKDRPTRAGGIVIYIRSEYTFKIIDDIPSNGTEQLWLSVYSDNVKICIGGLYRVPNGSVREFLELFEECLSHVVPSHDNIIIAGDFNINLNISNKNVNKLLSIIKCFGLKQIVKSATRITNKTYTLLDLIICSDHLIILESKVEERNEKLSDHCIVSCNIDL